jgi:hypothetical protein
VQYLELLTLCADCDPGCRIRALNITTLEMNGTRFHFASQSLYCLLQRRIAGDAAVEFKLTVKKKGLEEQKDNLIEFRQK